MLGSQTLAARCLVLSLLIAACSGQEEGPLVTTKYGTMEGVSLTQDGLPYDGFFGVPFGSSVSGEKRWTYPTDPPRWSGTYNATMMRPYCKQVVTPFQGIIGLNTVDSEDCLYLNIYVPGSVHEARDLPVMVFIYGGAFILGASDMYPGEDLAVTGHVIVVTINYRVGTMGFLSSGDRYAEGNYGLYDQLQALKWVKANIPNFGGDTTRITIFGQSAGSASVSHLALSPLTKGLFQRVISLSGSAAAYFGLTRALPATTKMTALTTACPSLNSKLMLNCLKKRRPYVLDMAGLAAPLVIGKGRVPNWVPRVDGYLVSDDPRYLLTKGANKHVDMIAGHTKDDGAFLIYGNPLGMAYNQWFSFTKSLPFNKSMYDFMLSPYKNPAELMELIEQQYPTVFDEDEDIRTQTGIEIMTDFFFASPAIFEVKNHAKTSSTSRTYYYEYAYRNSFFKYEEGVRASHIDDIHSVFGEPFLQTFRKTILQEEYTMNDAIVKTTVQKYYANFAYTGNPNQGPHEVSEFWPQYDDNSRSYMEFNLNSTSKTLGDRRYQNHLFWSETFWATAQYTTEDDAGELDHIEAATDLVRQILEWYEELVQSVEDGNFAEVLQEALNSFIEYMDKYELPEDEN